MIRPPTGRKVIFDTNVYVEAIRGGPDAQAYQLLLSVVPRTYLSAVVVQELLTGALDIIGQRLVERFAHQAERTGRIILPTYANWKEAGRVLARMSRREPALRTRVPRLVNDVLLALSARQIGATLYTFNRRDFITISRYARFTFESL
ncbi:MAG: type II toxin-antitoxin system VapC family toxin [Candidatus Methylomirabilaceae bacterium]